MYTKLANLTHTHTHTHTNTHKHWPRSHMLAPPTSSHHANVGHLVQALQMMSNDMHVGFRCSKLKLYDVRSISKVCPPLCVVAMAVVVCVCLCVCVSVCLCVCALPWSCLLSS